jgi:hypothetical protein
MSIEQGDSILIGGQTPTASLTCGTATFMVRVYYSSYHLWAATHFTQLAIAIENTSTSTPRFDIQHRAYVTSAILSSIAFLEGAINEVLKDVVDGHESYIESIDEASRNRLLVMWDLTEEQNRYTSILEKYQKVLQYCQKEQFSRGKQPYQDVDLVIKLRNELMHYKPNSYGGDIQHQFIKKLSGKFSDNPLMIGSGNPYFPDKCLGSSCADWAVHSTKRFVDEFFGRLSIVPNYQRVVF